MHVTKPNGNVLTLSNLSSQYDFSSADFRRVIHGVKRLPCFFPIHVPKLRQYLLQPACISSNLIGVSSLTMFL